MESKYDSETSETPAASGRPLVSVVMCVYNAGEYLRPALESVLHQTYTNIEIIVIDDGSTDDGIATISDIDDPRIQLLSQPNSGKPNALNRGLDRARGQYYAIQDADDLSHPMRIERQVACLEERPELAGVFCGYDLILDGRRLAPLYSGKTVDECRRDIEIMLLPWHDPTAMYRMSMVGSMRYDEDLPIVEGLDYVWRVGERYPLMALDDCLYSYRIHRESVTKKDPGKRERLLDDLRRRTLERRGLCEETFWMEGPGSKGPTSAKLLDNDLVSHFMQSVVCLRHHGRRREALRSAFACAMQGPSIPYYYKPLIYAVAPLGLVDAYRRRSRQKYVAARKRRFRPKNRD